MPEPPSVEELSGAQSEHQMQRCRDDLKPLPVPCSLESSFAINQSYSECGLFTISSFLVHPNCAQILKSCLYFQNYTYSPFFMYLVFAGLTLSVQFLKPFDF